MTKTKIIRLVLSAVLLSPVAANADLIIGNLGDPGDVGTCINFSCFTETKDAGWTMGSSSFLFSSAVLNLDLDSGPVTPVVQLFSGLTPTTFLVDLTLDTLGTGINDYSFSSASDIILAAGENYWLRVVSNPALPHYLWNGATVAPSGIATSAGYLFNGAPSPFFNRFEINGTLVQVPEPGTFGLLGIGLIGMGLARRRRKA